MPLYVLEQGYAEFVLPDFMTILQGDPGFGDDRDPQYPEYVLIRYKPMIQGYAQNIVNTIVNATLITVIQGVASSYTLPDGMLITTQAGVTFPPWQLSADFGNVALILYDVYECNSENYWVVDQTNQHIYFPKALILFHELIHAYDISEGLYKQTGDRSAEEIRAKQGENTLRARLSFPQRSVSSPDYGCGVSAPPSQKKNSYCFVNTAVYGESTAELAIVQYLKKAQLTRSRSVAAFFCELLQEYYAFSPGIVARIRESDRLRSAVRRLVVEPLLRFYTGLEIYASQGGAAAHLAWESTFASYVNFDRLEVAILCREIDRLVNWFEAGSHDIELAASPQVLAGDSSVCAVLALFIEALSSHSISRDRWRWALLEPLQLCWRAIKDSADGQQCIPSFMHEVYVWIANVPLPEMLFAVTETQFESEWKILAASVLRSEVSRSRFAVRLLERLPSDRRQRITSILASTELALSSEPTT